MKVFIGVIIVFAPLFSIAGKDSVNTKDFNNSDAALSEVYQTVLGKTHGEQRRLLVTAQDEWINYRNADCDFQTYTSRTGKLNETVKDICLQKKNILRKKELNDMLECQDGDLSCGFDD